MRRIYLILLMLVLTTLGLSTEAKADGVQLTLTNTTYDLGTGMFTLTGFFTNSGNFTFTANRWDVFFTPDLRPLEVRAIPFSSPDCCNYTQPVPGMSTSPILPLLEFSLIGPPVLGAGTYTGTLTFSGVGSNGDLNVTTAPVQFIVNVPEPVPEPATVLLLGTGLMAIGTAVRRRWGLVGSKS